MKQLWIVILFVACTSPQPEEVKVKPNATKDKKAIRALMAEQEANWNDGDLKGFMFPYLNSDELSFVGRSGLNKGWESTLENYQKSYPDLETMGELEFNNLEYQPLGKHHFLVIGQWALYRTSDTLSGHYSLVWQNTNEGWKIIADHSS